MNFEALFSTALSLFLFTLTGFVLRKTGVVDGTLTGKLSGFVAKACQPFLIIFSVVKLEYSTEKLRNGILVLAFSVLLHIFLALASKLFFSRVGDTDERKIHKFGCVFTNCAFVGFPILNALFGEAGLFYGAFYVIVYNLAVWSYGVVVMARGKPNFKISVRKMLVNLGTVPCAIGLGLYMARVPMPDFLMTVLESMSGLCTPLSLIVTGSLVASMPLRGLFNNPKIYYFCAAKLILIPLIAAVILRFAGLSGLVEGIDLSVFMVVLSSMPPAAFTTIFAELYDVKPAYAAQLLSVGTMLSPFTILLVMKLSEFIL
ncbi:MAG: hypothetical protein DBY04_06605 [Clostridiales bacterium]|nr:MAG: hypothetical protein DBY04_06605 [Clostridiales bacterium]